MKIHPLWFICILVRILLIVSILYFSNKSQNKKLVKILFCLLLLVIGLGFINKAVIGSNNEIQISKVFWHETRYVHGALYLLASIYLYNNNIKMTAILLTIDIIFSILYRIISKK